MEILYEGFPEECFDVEATGVDNGYLLVRIEKVPDNAKLRAGTTASVVVMTGTSTGSGRVPPVPRALQ